VDLVSAQGTNHRYAHRSNIRLQRVCRTPTLNRAKRPGRKASTERPAEETKSKAKTSDAPQKSAPYVRTSPAGSHPASAEHTSGAIEFNLKKGNIYRELPGKANHPLVSKTGSVLNLGRQLPVKIMANRRENHYKGLAQKRGEKSPP